jgi:hypothetical protein
MTKQAPPLSHSRDTFLYRGSFSNKFTTQTSTKGHYEEPQFDVTLYKMIKYSAELSILHVTGRIIWKWILEKSAGAAHTGLIWLRNVNAGMNLRVLLKCEFLD